MTSRRPSRSRLTVIGCGYLGTVHAACMADLGYQVLALDIDAERVTRLSAGKPPFHEPQLGETLRRGVESGRLRFTTSYDEVADFGDVHFLCVGTPQRDDEDAADLSQLNDAVCSLAPLLRRECLVVGRCTVPAGTAARLAEDLATLSPMDVAAELAWNPEFLREGHAVTDAQSPARIVAGVTSERAERILREVYGPLLAAGVPLIVTDYATAELAKVAANAFLATKISFINAMADVCEAAQGDVTTLAEVLSYDDRIGGKGLQAGLGFGGGCLPKDVRAFIARAGDLGADQAATLQEHVDAINLRRRSRTVELTGELLDGTFAGKRVAVWGAAFKPGSDDVRNSPALDVASMIRHRGAAVTVYDPAALTNAKAAYPELEYAVSAVDAATGAHAVLHLTEWQEFRDVDPAELGEVMTERKIVDGRAVLDAERWRAAGWLYRALGRP